VPPSRHRSGAREGRCAAAFQATPWTEHNDGLGARYTAKRLPVTIVYWEEHRSTESAIARERQLKRWTTSKKEALIVGGLRTLKSLSRRRVR
jgi:putative endonuclease